MISAQSLTNGTLTVIIDNGSKILTARNDHPRWIDLIEAYKSQNESRLLSLLSLQAVIEEYSIGQLSVNGTGVTYNGHPMHTVDSNRVIAFLRDGFPYKPIANYIARKMKNPSARAIKEMYSFLEHQNMTLTPDGTFIAYKGVRNDYYSVTGNKETIVLQGKVDTNGHILNEIGATIEVERSSVDDDFRIGCSTGLHAGSLSYAKGFGTRTILVEIDPANVVSVPDDCNCQKLRCCKYKVLGEYTGPMPNTYTAEFSKTENTNSEEDVCEDCGEIICNCADVCVHCNGHDCDCDCDNNICHDCNNSIDNCNCRCGCTCGGTDCPNCGCGCKNCGGIEVGDPFMDGKYCGIADNLGGKPSQFLTGDQIAADSPKHAQYIEGYLDGYNS